MNERIQELVKQAENYAAEQNDTFGVSYKKEYNQKFAELIVQGILKRLEDEREYYANPVPYEPDDYYIKMAGKKDAIDDAIAMIRSEFGVK